MKFKGIKGIIISRITVLAAITPNIIIIIMNIIQALTNGRFKDKSIFYKIWYAVSNNYNSSYLGLIGIAGLLYIILFIGGIQSFLTVMI